jgi:CheY-like chemotaxis protein
MGKVLIVDDVPRWQGVFSDLLSQEHDVTIADNYTDALNMLRNQEPPFHLAIIDIVLDECNTKNEDGLRLIEELRKMARYPEVIVVTGYSTMARTRRAFKQLAVFDYVEKYPFDHVTFRQAVREAVNKAESRLHSFVFVLMPFAEAYLAIYVQVVKKVVESRGIGCVRADDFFKPRRIMDDVRRCIRDATFLIADLSGRNPNVFYEVGLAHAIGKTVLLLTQSIDDVPPKLREVRNIVYADTLEGAEQLGTNLNEALGVLLAGEHRTELLFPNERYTVEANFCVALIPDTEAGKLTYKHIIEKVAREHGLTCMSHQTVFSTGPVMDEIWAQLNKAHIIISDLSGKDPDVFYLTGISHALNKDVVLLARNEEDIPFDLRGLSHIVYSGRTFSEGLTSRTMLAKVLDSVTTRGPERERTRTNPADGQ